MNKKIQMLMTVFTLVSLTITSCSTRKSDNKDLIKVFHKFEMSLDRSGKNLEEDNNKLLKILESKCVIYGEKAKPYRDNAFAVKQKVDIFIKYIDDIKSMFLQNYGGRDESKEGELTNGGNIDAASLYFLNPKDNMAKGKELIEKINGTRKILLDMLPIEDHTILKTYLYVPDSSETEVQSWLEETYNQLPLAATFVNLTKYQNDALKTANDIISNLIMKINAMDYRFDCVMPAISNQCEKVKVGEPYSARIYLAAYDVKTAHRIFVDGELIQVYDGSGIYKGDTRNLGFHKYKVEIIVTDPISGSPKTFTTYGEYNVIN